MTTDWAPEFLLGAYAGEGTIETYQLGSGTVNPGDLVKLSGTTASAASTVIPVVSSGDVAIGVVQRVWTAMGITWVSVVVRGKVKVTISGTVSVGAKLKAWSQHQVAAWVSGTDASNLAIGTAVQGGSSGDTLLAIVDCAAL